MAVAADYLCGHSARLNQPLDFRQAGRQFRSDEGRGRKVVTYPHSWAGRPLIESNKRILVAERAWCVTP
jgi:hypothetical protein